MMRGGSSGGACVGQQEDGMERRRPTPFSLSGIARITLSRLQKLYQRNQKRFILSKPNRNNLLYETTPKRERAASKIDASVRWRRSTYKTLLASGNITGIDNCKGWSFALCFVRFVVRLKLVVAALKDDSKGNQSIREWGYWKYAVRNWEWVSLRSLWYVIPKAQW